MAVSVAAGGVGARLKEARVGRGLSLEHAARATRIKPRFLRALERDAPPTAFRAPIYARAFLREYARFLGLDPDRIVSEYQAAHEEPEVRALELPMPATRPKRGRVGAVLLVALSVAALATLVVLSSRDVPEPRVAPAPAPTVAPEEEAVAVAPAEPPPPPPATEVKVKLAIRGRPSWVRVIAGRETVLEGTMEPGFTQTFRADRRIEVEIGDAGAARLTVDGEELGRPGGAGDVYRAAFVLRKGEVREAPL